MSASSIALLLRLLEAPQLRYAHDTVVEHHGAVGQALIDARFLVAADHMSVVTADDDDSAMVDVEMNPDRGEFGYHSPTQGWVKVEKAGLQCYHPDVFRIFTTLLGSELQLGDRRPIDLEGALLFDLELTRLLKRGPKSEVWYARRLSDRVDFDRIRGAIARRPSPRVRLLLTSTPHDRIVAESFPMMRIVPMSDVLSSAGDRIDAGILKARFAGVAPPVDMPLHLSEDGRHLTINGNTIVFRGPVIIAMLRILVAAYIQNERLPAGLILERSGSSATSLDQAFGKRWLEIKPYLKARGGTWGFEI